MKLNIWRMLKNLFIFGLIIYFSVTVIMNFLNKENSMETVTYGQLNLENKYGAIIFRNELLISTNISGNVRYSVSDGEKVKKKSKVMEIYFDANKVANINDKDEKNEDGLGESTQNLIVSEDDLEDEIGSIVDGIIQARKDGKFLQIKDLKQDLDLKIDKKNMLNNLSENINTSFQQTFVGQNELSEGQSIPLLAPKSGIVTFSTDDMESVLTLENIYTLDYEKLMKEPITVRSLSYDVVKAGEPVYKIVDNSLWMLVALIEKDEISLYEEGRYVNLEIDGQFSYGVISKVFETGTKGVLVLKMTEQIPDFQKTRLTEVKIIRENYQGLKVPKLAIVLNDSQQGVYILGVDNRAAFRPVKVIGYDDEYVIVKDGMINIEVDGKEKYVRSIEIHDEVLINGSDYRDGDKVR